MRPSGKPLRLRMIGRRNYAGVCSACGPAGEPCCLRVFAGPEQRKHRDSHKAALSPVSR
ncbi:hypothetical protein [Streptomyces sp. NPDC054901]